MKQWTFRFYCVAKKSMLIAVFWLMTSVVPSWATSGFPEMEEGRFQALLEDYEKNPTLLAEQRDLIKELSPQQLSDAISYLGLNHYTYLHPVEIRGRDIPSILGEDIKKYSVMSVRGGAMIPVPFQLDEYDESGFVYLEGEGDIGGTLGIVDDEDELVFMYRDTGRQRYDAMVMEVDGKVLRELEFTKNGEQRFAYIIEGSSVRNESRYVDYDFKTSTATNVFYGFKTRTDNFLMFEDFYANVGDKQGHRVLDSVYATIETRVLSRWSPKIHLNTFEHIKAVPVGVVKGPVRDAVIIALTVVVAKIPVFKIRAQMDIYDQMLGFNARINIPGADILTRFLVEPHIIIALDFNEQSGARVNSAISPEADGWEFVDGKVSDFESQMNIDRKKTWLWLSSNHGWDVFARINIPETFPVGVQLYYQDDPDDHIAYENFPGAFPRMGFDVYELPKNFSQIDLDVQFFFPDMLGMGPASFHKNETGDIPALAIRKPLTVSESIASD